MASILTNEDGSQQLVDESGIFLTDEEEPGVGVAGTPLAQAFDGGLIRHSRMLYDQFASAIFPLPPVIVEPARPNVRYVAFNM